MISLPSAYSSNINNPIWYIVRITVLNSGTPQYIHAQNQNSATLGTTLQYSGSTVTPSLDYIGAEIANGFGSAESVDGIGEIDMVATVADGGGIAPASEMQFVFLNQGNFSGNNLFDFENQEIELWEGRVPSSVPGTIEITTSFVCRFKGIIRNVGEQDSMRFIIPAVDHRYRDDIQLPNIKVSKALFPAAPKASVGSVLPILIGDFDTDNASGSPVNTIQLGQFNGAPTVTVDEPNSKFVAADHDYTYGGGVGVAAIANEDLTAVLASARTTSGTDANGFKYVQALADLYADAYVQFKRNAKKNDTTDLSALCDGDQTTYLEIGGATYGTTALLVMAGLKSFGEPGLLLNKNYEYAYDASTDFILKLYTECVGSVPADWNCPILYHDAGTAFNIVTTPTIASNGVITVNVNCNTYNTNVTWSDLCNKLAIGFGPSAAANYGTKFLRIHHVWIEARTRLNTEYVERHVSMKKYDRKLVPIWAPYPQGYIPGAGAVATLETTSNDRPSALSSIYPSCKGAKYTWTRGGHATGDTITDPAGAIEWILRNKLGVAAGRIDTTSFDAVGNTTTGSRRSWAIAGSINRESNAYSHLAKICFEFSLVLQLTADSKYRLIAMDPGTAVYTLQLSDLSADGSMAVSLGRTSNDKIINDYFADYRVSYSTNNPERSKYVSDVLVNGTYQQNLTINGQAGAPRLTNYTAWLGDSRTRYSTMRSWHGTFEFIRDDSTAEIALKKLMDWWSFQRITVRCQVVKNANTLALQAGDQVQFTSGALNIPNVATTNFVITRINYPAVSKVTLPYINMEFEEMPNSNTGQPSGASFGYLSFMTSEGYSFVDSNGNIVFVVQ